MLVGTDPQQPDAQNIVLPPRDPPKSIYTITDKSEARAYQYLQKEVRARIPPEAPPPFKFYWLAQELTMELEKQGFALTESTEQICGKAYPFTMRNMFPNLHHSIHF